MTGLRAALKRLHRVALQAIFHAAQPTTSRASRRALIAAGTLGVACVSCSALAQSGASSASPPLKSARMQSILAQTPSKTVAVLAIVEHPALDAIRDGVREGLRDAGFETGKNLTWRYQSAQGSASTAAQIARQFIGEQPAAIVALATPSAQAVLAATRSVPIVYAGVTDPVAAQLVTSLAPSGGNVTGVSDRLPLDRQIALIKRIVPRATRVGIVYNPGEANSVVVVQALRKLLPATGMRLVEAAAPRTVDIAPAAKNLIGKVDVIYTSTDNNVVSAYEALVKVCNEARIPLIAADTDSVKRGAVAALGIDYYRLGKQAGAVVARILNGTPAGSIASASSSDLRLFVNPGAARRQGIELSDALLRDAQYVVR